MNTPNAKNPTAKLELTASSLVFHLREALEPLVPGLDEKLASTQQTLDDLNQRRSDDLASLRQSRSEEDVATDARRVAEDVNIGQRRAGEDAAFEAAHAHISDAEAAAVMAQALHKRIKGLLAGLRILERTEGMTAAELQTPAQKLYTLLLSLLDHFDGMYASDTSAENTLNVDEIALALLSVAATFDAS
jgi:hypothetical protein